VDLANLPEHAKTNCYHKEPHKKDNYHDCGPSECIEREGIHRCIPYSPAAHRERLLAELKERINERTSELIKDIGSGKDKPGWVIYDQRIIDTLKELEGLCND